MFATGLEPHSPGDVGQLRKGDSDEEDLLQQPSFEPVSVARQEHENDVAEVVLVSEPEGASISMGGLHPRASLYERPVNLDASKRQHAQFRQVLRSYGIKGVLFTFSMRGSDFLSMAVLTVRGILAYGAGRYINARMELEDLAMNALTYVLNPAITLDDLSESDRYSISDAYKRTVVPALDEWRVDGVELIVGSGGDVGGSVDRFADGLEAKYEYQPLSNLIYTRDQQITTAKGVVMGRLQSNQRRAEVELLTYCFQKLGVHVLGAVEEPGYLEGGDFYPAGLDLCFMGIGLRSNFDACEQLMEKGWLGTTHVAVVKDMFDQSQERMHLDCVFNITGSDSCIMLEDIMLPDSPMRRLVDEYRLDILTQRYTLALENIEFGEYVQSKGFNIIPVKCEDQLKYACNVLNLGQGRILSVSAAASREMVRSPHFHGRIEAIDFSSITSMYGAVHCSTQVLKRRSAHKAPEQIPSNFVSLPCHTFRIDE